MGSASHKELDGFSMVKANSIPNHLNKFKKKKRAFSDHRVSFQYEICNEYTFVEITGLKVYGIDESVFLEQIKELKIRATAQKGYQVRITVISVG